MDLAAQRHLLTMGELTRHNRVVSSLGLALLYYDFLFTVPLEVERYWTGRISWPSVCFFLNRYIAILSHIPVIYEYFFTMPESRCRDLQLYHQSMTAFMQGIVAVCMVLRIHALSSYMRDRRIFYFLGGILVPGTIVCVWAVVWFHITEIKSVESTGILSTGCDLEIPTSHAIVLAVSWGIMFIFDGTVFALTVREAICVHSLWCGSYATLMLKDGAIYFGVLGICYLSNIIALAIAPTGYKGILTTLTNILSNLLVSRMMLNIRDPKLFRSSYNCPSMVGEVPFPDDKLSPPFGLGDAVSSFWPRASISAMTTEP